MRIPLVLLLFICSIPLLRAQQPEDKNVFKVTPSGILLIDGAIYVSPEKELFKDGMAIPEARLGAKMSYGKWSSWIDVGFAYGKIGLRNMWIQYDFSANHAFRIGNFPQSFGYESPTTYSFKNTFEIPLAAALFTPSLQLGAMYTFQNPSFYATASFHVESSALTNVMNYPLFNQQGYSFLTRLIWREKNSSKPGNPIIQAGINFGFSTPQQRIVDNEDIHDGFQISANFPTKVTTLQAVGTTIANSRNLFKFSPEILLSYKKLALETEYYYQRINRSHKLPEYTSQGFFATIRGIILGKDYSYDSNIAHLGNPKNNTLELVADYNWAKLTDPSAGIFGGNANSFNFTLNYYFNPYITARLNYSYTYVWGKENFHSITQNVIQARIMVLF